MRRKCGSWAERGWVNEPPAQTAAWHNRVPALRPSLQPLTRAFPVRIEFDLMFGDTLSIVNDMQAVGYVRVSTERQADQGVSLDAQDAKGRAMATVQGATLVGVIVDGGESAKSLNRPGLQRLLALVNGGKVQAVIVA